MRMFTKTPGDAPHAWRWTAASALFAAIGGVAITRWFLYGGEPAGTVATLATFTISAGPIFAALRLLPDALWRCIGYGLVASAAGVLEVTARHAPAGAEAVHAAPLVDAPARPRVIS